MLIKYSPVDAPMPEGVCNWLSLIDIIGRLAGLCPTTHQSVTSQTFVGVRISRIQAAHKL